MSEWKEYRLEDFADINPTESIPKGTIAKKIPMEFIQPFTKRIPNYSLEEYKGGVKFRNGDTLMARITPSLENGKTSYVDILEEDEIGFGSTEFIVLREKENVSDKHFLYYLAISPTIRFTAIKSMTGSSGRQRVQTDVVKEHVFDAPELAVQQTIASVLSSLDDKIDLLHRQNQTLEQMAETLFRQWFVEEADEGWENLILEDLCEIRNGYAFKSKDYRESGHVIVRTKDFDHGYVSITDPVFLAEELTNNYDKFQLSRRELLLVMVGASLGKTVIVTGDILPALQNQNMWAFKAHNELHQFYLNYLVKELVKENLYIASGSARSFFQKGSFYKFPVSLPPEELLFEANIHFEQCFNKIELNRSQIKSLEGLRDTLLPKLMNGEIRIDTNE